AGFLLMRRELIAQVLGVLTGQDMGKIHHTSRQGRDVQCRYEKWIEKKSKQDDEPCRRSPDTAHTMGAHHWNRFS
ncbi:MAG TPA: hypothetical protein VFO87_11630, partial [Nitrospira sp.]|nr:hypothetical protein [Nitrospira sp.]